MVQKKMQARERVEQVFISAAKSLLIWDFVGWSRAGCVCPGARLPLVPTAAPSDLTWFSFTPASGVSVSLQMMPNTRVTLLQQCLHSLSSSCAPERAAVLFWDVCALLDREVDKSHQIPNVLLITRVNQHRKPMELTARKAGQCCPSLG